MRLVYFVAVFSLCVTLAVSHTSAPDSTDSTCGCQNGGICVDHGGHTMCQCDTDVTSGEYCEVCLCENGGDCHDHGGGEVECHCPDGTVEPLCTSAATVPAWTTGVLVMVALCYNLLA